MISRSSLKFRLFLLLLVAIIPLAGALVVVPITMKAARIRQIHDEAYRTGELAALEISRLVIGLEDTLAAVSAASALDGDATSMCGDYLARVGRQMPQFAGIAVLDARGTVRCRQSPGGEGISLADRPYIREALAGRRAVGTYLVGRLSDAKILPIAVPIIDGGGSVKGVVAGSLNLTWLQTQIKERNFAPGGNLTIADRDGVILARFPDPDRFVGTRIPDEYQRLVRTDQPGTLELTSQDGTRRILAYFPPDRQTRSLYVSAGLSTEEEFRGVTRATYVGIVVILFTCLSVFLAAALTARRSIQLPVNRLLETVQSWRSQDETARTGMRTEDGEFGQLGHAIDAYMDELVSARRQRRRDEERQRLLMGELDHRVKNLLATVQSVARQTFRSAGTEPSVIETFNRRLAAIAEAHALLMRGVEQSASLTELVAVAIKPFDLHQPSRFSVEGPDLVLNSRAALALGMALHELCTNAVKYGALSSDIGRVRIVWHLEEAMDHPILHLSWQEMDGPPVRMPDRQGFGSLMIERILSSQIEGKAEIHFAEDGLVARLRAPLPPAGLNVI
ncbi:two-component sensor histidine kinase [Rhizobium aquaticum]|uniref:histidine kinase n=1 Tax=Rhizobium aquaticum TaxID=1549636 RepID=A0ABV2J4V6_9HYPH